MTPAVHCTVYSVQYTETNSVKSLYAVTSTSVQRCNECTRSHQLRTMNVRSLSTP